MIKISGGGFIGGVSGGPSSEGDIEKLEDIAKEELQKETPTERRRVFISFRHTDKNQVDALRSQAKNENSELDFIDMGLRVPFNSENAEYIKQGIRARIQHSSVTLVAVSETTYKSNWVNWEISESLKLGKGVVIVNISKNTSIRMPEAANENGGRVKVVPWKHKEIMDAIESVADGN